MSPAPVHFHLDLHIDRAGIGDHGPELGHRVLFARLRQFPLEERQCVLRQANIDGPVLSPVVPQHSTRGPDDVLRRFDLVGVFQAQDVRLRSLGIETRRLAVHRQRRVQPIEPHEISRREHHGTEVRLTEIGHRQQHPLNLGLGILLDLHAAGESLVHPRLRLSINQGCLEGCDDLPVLSLIEQPQHVAADRDRGGMIGGEEFVPGCIRVGGIRGRKLHRRDSDRALGAGRRRGLNPGGRRFAN